MIRIRHLLAKLFILCVSLVLCLLAVELASRVYLTRFASSEDFKQYASYRQLRERYGPAGSMFSPHPYLGYAPTPNYVSGANRHNSLGFRGPEIALPKPDGEYRIVCLGASTTYTSHVLDFRSTYPALLQTTLHNMGDDHVVVINGGTPGWTTWETLISFQFRVLDLDPDMVIIYHGVNDVGPRLVWPDDAYRGDNTGARIADSAST